MWPQNDKERKLNYSEYLLETISVLSQMESQDQAVSNLVDLVSNSLSKGGTLYFCGNGGSAADAQHWAAEFIGQFRISGKPIAAVALTTNTSIITAIANDIAYEKVFSRQLEATGSTGDVLFAISTSGQSESILDAARVARQLGIHVLGFTGADGGKLAELSDLTIKVPSNKTELIQHVHVTLGHYIAGEIEEVHRIRG